MRRFVLAVAASSALFAACGGGLSDQAKAEILAGCLNSGGTQRQCQCAVDYYEDAGVETADDLTQEVIAGAVAECSGGPQPGPTGT